MSMEVALDMDTQNLILDKVPLEKAWWMKRHHRGDHGFWGDYLRHRFGSFKKIFRLLAERDSNTRKKRAVALAFREHWTRFYVHQSVHHEFMNADTEKEKVKKVMVVAMATGLSLSFRRLPELVEKIMDARDHKDISAAIGKYANDLLESEFATLWESEDPDSFDLADRDDIHDAIDNFSILHAHSAVLEAWVDRPF